MDRMKKWMIAGAVLLGAGVLISGIAFACSGFDFRKLGTVQYETNTYEVSGDFQNITIQADTEDISFLPSDDGTCRVVCREEEKEEHQVSIQNDTLTITRKEKRGWQFLHFGIITENPKLTAYLPGNAYKELSVDADTGDVAIPEDFAFDSISVTLDTGDISCQAKASGTIRFQTDTGDISISDGSASDLSLRSDTGRMEITDIALKGDMDVEEDTGRVTLKNVTCTNLTSNGSTGSLIMSNIIASGEFHLDRDTGGIEFNGCDAKAIYVRTDTGNVTGTLLSDKIFITDTDTGRVTVPKTITGGRCEITTNTGDIKMDIQ